MTAPRRDSDTKTPSELAGLSALELAKLALRADDDAWAIYAEHQDAGGTVSAAVRRRAAAWARLSDDLARLACARNRRRRGARQGPSSAEPA